jgi:hypothetical protein
MDNGKGLSTRNRIEERSISTKLISDFIKKTTKTEIKVTPNYINSDTKGVKVSFLIPHKISEND